MPYKFAKTIKVHTSFIHSVAFSPNGELFTSAGADRTVYLHQGASGEMVGPLDGSPGHAGGVFAASWNADSRRVATSSADMTVKIWDVETKKVTESVVALP